jgi:hypothetical protein
LKRYLQADYAKIGAQAPDKRLQPLAYTQKQALDRIELIVNNFSASGYRKKAAEEWTRKELNNFEFQVKYHSPESSACLRPYFDLFNRMFFDESLAKSVCTFEMVHRGDRRWMLNSCARHFYGSAKQLIMPESPVHAKVKILLFENPKRSKSTRLQSYVGALLHEMIHAYFQLYTCSCRKCVDEERPLRGVTGHGIAWQRAAKVIEDFMQVKFQVFIPLCRATAFGGELFVSGDDISPEPLMRLRLDIESVEEGFQRARLMEERREKEVKRRA